MMTNLAPVKPVVSQTNWVPYSPPTGWFQVEMPASPTTSQIQDASPVGTITTHIFSAKEGGATFSVSYSDLPALAIQFVGADGLMGQAKSSMLRDQNARELSFDPATMNGLSGKRLVYETTTNGTKRTGEAFFTLNNTRLYVLDALVPVGSEALAQKFFQSFTLKN
ncbi:hypothetical protein [Gloeomargarita lithophora]|nr:hypothetical protein [Gloeomargarita lithophora]